MTATSGATGCCETEVVFSAFQAADCLVCSKETGASGFRFDAVKHINAGFIGQFVKHVREQAKNDDLFMVGPLLNSYAPI